MIIKLAAPPIVPLGAGKGFIRGLADRAKIVAPQISHSMKDAIKPITAAIPNAPKGMQEIKTFADEAVQKLQAQNPLQHRIDLHRAAETAKSISLPTKSITPKHF